MAELVNGVWIEYVEEISELPSSVLGYVSFSKSKDWPGIQPRSPVAARIVSSFYSGGSGGRIVAYSPLEKMGIKLRHSTDNNPNAARLDSDSYVIYFGRGLTEDEFSKVSRDS